MKKYQKMTYLVSLKELEHSFVSHFTLGPHKGEDKGNKHVIYVPMNNKQLPEITFLHPKCAIACHFWRIFQHIQIELGRKDNESVCVCGSRVIKNAICANFLKGFVNF